MPIKQKANEYLCKQLKKTCISLDRAKVKPGVGAEVDNLQNRMEVLRYLSELVAREGGSLERP